MSAAMPLLRRLLHRRSSRDSTGGFTLIELLVTIILASGIISGLMYLAVETLQSDQRESDRTETQRDMQLALSFIESELRQAVFVYDADCLDGTEESGCSGLDEWGLDLPDGLTPVLAFWRLQPLPADVQTACAAGAATDVPCLSGNSYSLVVYSLGVPDEGAAAPLTQLNGQAGIFRSDMSITDVDPTDDYVSPFQNGPAQFRTWPLLDGAGTPVFSEPELLVDYVDSGTGDLPAGVDPSCPTPTDFYQLTPSDGVPRSFYTCVSQINATTSGNQDVVLYLRGNAEGRSGLMREDTFLPPIETRVFIRGTLDETPS